jgi:hypothetical protein
MAQVAGQQAAEDRLARLVERVRDWRSTVTSSRPVPFEQAVAAALERLRDDESFGCAVDVRAAVRTEYRPLPIRAVPMPEIAGEAASAAPQAPADRLLALAAALPVPEEPAVPAGHRRRAPLPAQEGEAPRSHLAQSAAELPTGWQGRLQARRP